MNIGIIVESQKIVDEIQCTFFKDPFLFVKTGVFGMDIEDILISASRVHLDIFIISLDAIEDEPLFIRSLRKYRIQRPNTKVIIIGVDRKVGDPTIVQIVQMGIFDIIAPSTEHLNEDEEVDLAYYVKQKLEKPSTYADAARWIVDIDLEEEENKHGREHQEIVTKKKIVYKERLIERLIGSTIIAIGSGHLGAGSTFTSIQLSSFLANFGSVACVELVDPAIDYTFFSDLIHEELGKTMVKVEKVDFFPREIPLHHVLQQGYQFVVLDLGLLVSGDGDRVHEHLQEFFRANESIIVNSPQPWLLNSLANTVNVIADSIIKKPTILFSPCTLERRKAIAKEGQKEIFSQYNMLHNSYHDDVFSCSAENSETYYKIMKDYLPKQNNKRNLFKFLMG